VIRVLLVDDHPVVRAGLRGLLESVDGIAVVGEAGSGTEAVTAARALSPDVVLMDLRMPGGDGVVATERIRAAQPDTRVVVLTTYETDADILRAVEAGAAGYLLKDAGPAELTRAVFAVALSAREVEVLRRVARGLSNPEIGRELHITEATVKTHLLRIFQKLGVSDRTAAVTTAMSSGLL
jgi:DNA-binding NarL/FixJ family response regulator